MCNCTGCAAIMGATLAVPPPVRIRTYPRGSHSVLKGSKQLCNLLGHLHFISMYGLESVQGMSICAHTVNSKKVGPLILADARYQLHTFRYPLCHEPNEACLRRNARTVGAETTRRLQLGDWTILSGIASWGLHLWCVDCLLSQ